MMRKVHKTMLFIFAGRFPRRFLVVHYVYPRTLLYGFYVAVVCEQLMKPFDCIRRDSH